MNPDTWERVVCADLGRKLDICFLMEIFDFKFGSPFCLIKCYLG